MLNIETKRHIDSARQVLVGKVPDPKSQIEQITNALIYKFMDDMDARAIAHGGQATFFTDNLAEYSWSKLMDRSLGAQDRMNRYDEALRKFGTAKQLPPLFRTIFKEALLPFKSPETLNLFLNEITYFNYKNSEELGNAFEYLLSTLGTQGDAGQFRTPRHIIDFIVDVIDPKKTDTILDPACGTAGFLISAFKHIAEAHDGVGADGKSNDEKRLTPIERKKIMENITGYDISPDMVRLSLVNMYLHGSQYGLQNPNIIEYDTLSQTERWDEKFDVILANPPFMTPKGGVMPHNKFEVTLIELRYFLWII
jgi:type I restriction enzyme M protein